MSTENYLAGWVHHDVCLRLQEFSEAVRLRKSPRLMLLMPPRHGKSFIATERFPIWHLGRNANHQIVVVSYGQVLPNKFSRRAREVARSELMHSVFPKFDLDPDSQAVSDWQTLDGGGYRAVGVGGGLTGMGADILIIDDLIKDASEANSKRKRDSDHDWYKTTGYSRLMPGGGVLVIQTRWHEDDLPGRFMKAMADDAENIDQFEIISYPAIAEKDEIHRRIGEALHIDRYNIDALNKIKANIGNKAWVSLYQQRPSTEEGNLIKRHWWRRYDKAPTRFEVSIISWDCAFKDNEDSDYVVATVWGKLGADFYLLDVFRDRIDFVQTCKAVELLAKKHVKSRPILVEDKANGTAVMSQLKKRISGLVPICPKESKETRVVAITPLLEAGNVHIPYSDMDVFVDECAAFPRGANDDQVDSMTQALIYLDNFSKNSYFSGLFEYFGSPDTFHDAPWVSSEVCTSLFCGVYFDKQSGQGSFVAFNQLGNLVVVAELSGDSQPENAKLIRELITKTKASQSFVWLSKTSYAETIAKFFSGENWQITKYTPSDIEGMFNNFTLELKKEERLGETKPLKLPAVGVLFDHLSFIRAVSDEKGSLIFQPTQGLSAPSAFALVIAYKNFNENKNRSMKVGVFDPIAFMNKILND